MMTKTSTPKETNMTDIVKMLAENREFVEANLNELWRRQAEDMMAAGINQKDVAETMLSVAAVQCMKVHGSARMVEVLRQQADVFEVCAEEGVEFADLKPMRLDS